MAINYASLGNALGTGLGAGLEQLAQNKMKGMEREKFAKSLNRIGYTPEEADTLAYLQQNSPEHFHHILGMAKPTQQGTEQKQALFSNPKSEAQELKIEARKDKLRPELTYLDELETTAKELRTLINDKKEPVEFGNYSAIASNIPIVGNQLLGKNTGAFDALSNKFHTDATQGSKNVRSVYHVKILGASKPSLTKTKEQNEKLLDYWQKVIDKKRSAFLKAHPEFANEVEVDLGQSSDQQQSQQVQQMQQAEQQESQPRFRKNAAGKVQQWDQASQSYRDL